MTRGRTYDDSPFRSLDDWAIADLTDQERDDFWDALNAQSAHTCPDCRRVVVRTDGHRCQVES